MGLHVRRGVLRRVPEGRRPGRCDPAGEARRGPGRGEAAAPAVAVTMISPLEARYYRRRMPLMWWAKRRSYTKFMLRELSSLFVALFVVELLFLVRRLGQRPPPARRLPHSNA